MTCQPPRLSTRCIGAKGSVQPGAQRSPARHAFQKNPIHAGRFGTLACASGQSGHQGPGRATGPCAHGRRSMGGRDRKVPAPPVPRGPTACVLHGHGACPASVLAMQPGTEAAAPRGRRPCAKDGDIQGNTRARRRVRPPGPDGEPSPPEIPWPKGWTRPRLVPGIEPGGCMGPRAGPTPVPGPRSRKGPWPRTRPMEIRASGTLRPRAATHLPSLETRTGRDRPQGRRTPGTPAKGPASGESRQGPAARKGTRRRARAAVRQLRNGRPPGCTRPGSPIPRRVHGAGWGSRHDPGGGRKVARRGAQAHRPPQGTRVTRLRRPTLSRRSIASGTLSRCPRRARPAARATTP
jgi:hypothetical protein